MTKLIATSEALREEMRRLGNVPMLALDTESDSFYHYPERLCLIQIFSPAGGFLVDALAVRDLSPLVPILQDRRIEKIMHAAEYDISCLKRACPAIRVEGLFDTSAAGRVLGWENLSLAAMLKEHFRVAMDKRMQRSNWGRRPLSPQQTAYALEDVRHLAALRDLQYRELASCNRLEEARDIFARVAKTEPFNISFNPDGFHYLKGAENLGPKQLAALRQLYLYREDCALRLRVPPFKVLSNALLVDLARRMPFGENELLRVPGMSFFLMHRFAKGILAITSNPDRHPPAGHPPRARKELTPSQIVRYGRLKEWRKITAQERGVSPEVILPSEVLKDIVKAGPREPEDLSRISSLSPREIKAYGEAILKALLFNGSD